MSHLSFSTKASTLKQLEPILQSATIKPQVTFTVSEWSQKPEELLNLIQKELRETILIVRSSALQEDSYNQSMAGHFRSIGGISKDDPSQLTRAISSVIESYGVGDPGDQVLIQGQIEKIKAIGVIVTRDLSTLGPYYVVNYDDHSGSIDGVTSGKGASCKTYVRFKKSPSKPANPMLQRLIKLISELEEIFNCDRLDIEFALDESDKLYLLQVRPIAVKNKVQTINDDQIAEALRKIHHKVEKLNGPYPFLYGDTTIFGVMPDWNPAEILGSRPRMLALSLYKELVTDSIWAYQRNNYGYKNLRSFPLMRSFLGTPYIDARLSFNSFVPKDLDDAVAHRLVNYYLDRLRQYPSLHDKVEFQIVFSCYDLTIDQRLNVLADQGFSDDDIFKIKKALLDLTNRIVDPLNGPYLEDLRKIEILKSRQQTVMSSSLSLVDKIYWLIEDCKRFGTLPFAGLARAGFIAVQFLNSLVELGVFSKDDRDSFMASLNTVARQLSDDSSALRSGVFSREEFLAKYGHLRPGTYDILSSRYDEDFDRYFGHIASNLQANVETHSSDKKFEFSAEQLNKIDSALISKGINLNAESLISFLKMAIEGREYSKFIFSKSLSDALVLISKLGTRFSIDKEKLSHLDIKRVTDLYASLTNDDLPNIFMEDIDRNARAYECASYIKLPQLIVHEDDIFDFFIEEGEPNFVSTRRASGEVVRESNFKTTELKGKIVMIPSADPGYDWIFSHDIAGLITMFGGANSHMAIRAAELKLPAVIGAGELNFNNWSKARCLEIDCANRTVIAIG